MGSRLAAMSCVWWGACDWQCLSDRAPQVERGRIFEVDLERRHVDRARRVAVILETRAAPRLGFIGVDREGFVVASARMGDVIHAAAERAPAPGVDDVERQRRLD